MRDVNNLLKKIGGNYNSERAIHLFEMALKALTIPSYDDNPETNFTSEIAETLFNMETISKEIQQKNCWNYRKSPS